MKRNITPDILLAALIVLLVVFSLVDTRPAEKTIQTSTTESFVDASDNRGVPLAINLNMFSFGYWRDQQTSTNDQYLFFSGYRLRPGASSSTNDGVVKFKQSQAGDGSVLVPVNSTTFTVFKVFCWALAACLFIMVIYVLAFKGTGIILRIARGDSFNKKNIRGLFMIGWTLLALGLLPLVSNLIASLFISNRIPSEIHYNWLENINRWQGWLLAGLVVLVFARAFRKGNELQLDNALTV